jgi:hypothetical protein
MAERELPRGATPEPQRAGAPQEPSTVVPKKDYKRISVPGETEQRRALLESVRVDAHGVAHNTSPRGVETMLVAVRVNDEKQASVVPFEATTDIDGEQVVQFALPADIPSRVGFFLGWKNSVNELSAATRAGLYPGTPLITSGSGEYTPAQEVMLGLRGIKGTEEQEREWAEQVALFTDLGFDQGRSRGFFDKASRPNDYTTSWEVQPLLMLPRVDDPDYEHFDRQQVEGSALQMLYYATAPKVERPAYDFGSSYSGGFGDRYGATRSMSMGGDLGLGFGRSSLQSGSTTAIELKGLEGAFRIAAVPQKS